MFCIYRILLASLARLEPNRVRRVTVLLKMNERESLIELAVEKPWNCVQFVVWRSDRRSAVRDSLSVVLCYAVTTDATSLKVPPSPTSSPYITSSVASAICMEVDSVYYYFNVQPMILKSEEDRDYSELILFSVQLFVLSLTTIW